MNLSFFSLFFLLFGKTKSILCNKRSFFSTKQFRFFAEKKNKKGRSFREFAWPIGNGSRFLLIFLANFLFFLCFWFGVFHDNFCQNSFSFFFFFEVFSGFETHEKLPHGSYFIVDSKIMGPSLLISGIWLIMKTPLQRQVQTILCGWKWLWWSLHWCWRSTTLQQQHCTKNEPHQGLGRGDQEDAEGWNSN